jgi:hypothetical protein
VLLDQTVKVFGRDADELLLEDEELFTTPKRRGMMDVVFEQQA